ncbi:MAG: 50S ribosomal protein L23 [Chloroflexi bacterium]|nr:50S ribosomal protein L23 [Chloroflexota bacterium]
MPKTPHPLEVLRRPLITEKGTRLVTENKYLFEVLPHANRRQIKEAIETAFNVRVVKVSVMNMKGKPMRARTGVTAHRPDWKKAVVTLAEGDKLELFEGI